MSNFDEKVVDRIKRLEREVERLRVKEKQVFVPLTTPLTSTAWDGDSFSTTGKTLIDLSAVFGVPAGVKAVIAEVSIRDSGSAGTTCRIVLSANNTSYSGAHCLAVPVNDAWIESQLITACDANGDIYYQIVASGVSTFEIYLSIIGYWL